MSEVLYICQNCGENYYEKDAIKIIQGLTYKLACPKCKSLDNVGTLPLNGTKLKSVEPKFKVGDKITNGKTQLTILKITSYKYIVEDNFGECGTLFFNTQDDWEFVEEETKQLTNKNMNKALFTCKNCGKKFYKKDSIKIKRGYKYMIACPKCNSLEITHAIPFKLSDFESEITTELKPLTETKPKPKFKAGDRVFNKVTRKWVDIIEFNIDTNLYIVRYDDGIQGRSLESELIKDIN